VLKKVEVDKSPPPPGPSTPSGRLMVGGLTELGGKFVLVSLLAFITSHAVGQGAVIWLFIGEFPNRLRARGQAFGCSVHRIFAAAISLIFPMIVDTSGGHVFTFYTVCMFGQLIWVILRMPETKGLTLETIQKELGID
jgi:MFS transporter, SP family, xylose:H+ symportor